MHYGTLTSCFLGLLRLMKEEHYKRYLDSFGKDRQRLADFLSSVFNLFLRLIKDNAFPSDWMVMRMLQNEVILAAVQSLSTALTEHFLTNQSFNQSLWKSFFQLSVKFLCQDDLQVERFSDTKRDKILSKYQDRRGFMAYQISANWQELGENQAAFVPDLIDSLQEMALVPEVQLRKVRGWCEIGGFCVMCVCVYVKKKEIELEKEKKEREKKDIESNKQLFKQISGCHR